GGELAVGDERRTVWLEDSLAEHVLGKHVRIDYLADRLVGPRPDRIAQICPHLFAAQGVDHGDGVTADDKAGIRHVAAIFRRLYLIAALMHEDAGRDLAYLDA